MKSKNERRKYGRLTLSYPVEITSPKKIKNSRTQDVSIRGLCLITPVSFKENSLLKMKLKLDPEKNINVSVQGKVVWKLKKNAKEYHHGILITDIKESERDTFRKLLATKLIDLLLK
ncbi:MAG: PilZ domain-containing protein [Candidatus Saelkia tenebricola]|nr:PilZ domain-containing protein [Candidatus Saelkia tenebricola]